MQRNIIYILLFILFCQCTSAIRKDIKWIAITDIYEEFGINSYDIEFDEFYFVDENTLTVNMTRLRKKLAEHGINDLIKTKKGLGYIIE